MRHINDLLNFSTADLTGILDCAIKIKASPEDYRDALLHQSLAMLFQKTSTRTRVSFEVAMTELGGHAIYMDWQTSNFILTDLAYEIEYLSRNVQVIMARLLSNDDFQIMADASQVPMINGCCDRYHPCQALTDVLTMIEHSEKPLPDLHLLYSGVQNNVSNSLILMADRLGFSLTLATPEPEISTASFDPRLQAITQDSEKINHVDDPRIAIDGADFIYTDTWIDMQFFNDPEKKAEKAALLTKMQPFQVNESLIEGHDLMIMHDMPIHNDYEITPGLVRDPRSIIFNQAANRLHAQKGLLYWLLNAQTSP